MIAPPPVAIGSFLMLTGALLISAMPLAKGAYWIGEIQGSSMTPTLWGERVAFNCRECGRQVCIEREMAQVQPLLQCDQCGAWQILPELAAKIPADRVVIGPPPKGRPIGLGKIVAIDHPIYGLTIKRVAAVKSVTYFVVGDHQDNSTDSRNPSFGLVASDQIRGIVVKILPTRSLAPAKRSR